MLEEQPTKTTTLRDKCYLLLNIISCASKDWSDIENEIKSNYKHRDVPNSIKLFSTINTYIGETIKIIESHQGFDKSKETKWKLNIMTGMWHKVK